MAQQPQQAMIDETKRVTEVLPVRAEVESVKKLRKYSPCEHR